MTQLCIYCQKNPGITDDHVPPEAIFEKPYPADRIFVPSCQKCNNGFSADDDYFLRIAMEWGASETKAGERVKDARLRSLVRSDEHSRRKWLRFKQSLEWVKVVAPTGETVDSLAFRLDMSRIYRTLDRIIRGLYYEVTKTALPLKAYIRTMHLPEYVEKNQHDPEAMMAFNFLPTFPGRTIGDGTFAFKYWLNDDRPFSSIWFVEFYGRLAFIGSTEESDESMAAVSESLSDSQSQPG